MSTKKTNNNVNSKSGAKSEEREKIVEAADNENQTNWFSQFKNTSIYGIENLEDVAEAIFNKQSEVDDHVKQRQLDDLKLKTLANEERIVSFDVNKVGVDKQKLIDDLKEYYDKLTSSEDASHDLEQVNKDFSFNHLLDYAKCQSPNMDYVKDHVLRSFGQTRTGMKEFNPSRFMAHSTKFIKENNKDITAYNKSLDTENKLFSTYHKLKYRYKFSRDWSRQVISMSGSNNENLESVLSDVKMLFQHSEMHASTSSFRTQLLNLSALLSHRKLTQDVITSLMKNQPRFGLTRNKDLTYTDKEVERTLESVLVAGNYKNEIKLMFKNELLKNIYLKLLCFELSTFFTIKYLNKTKIVKTFQSSDISRTSTLLDLARFEKFIKALGKFFEVLEETSKSDDFDQKFRLSESLMFDTIAENRRVLISVIAYMNNFETYLLTLQTLLATKHLQIKNSIYIEKPELLNLSYLDQAEEVAQLLIPSLFSTSIIRNALSFNITSEDAKNHCELLMNALDDCDLIVKQDLLDYHNKFSYTMMVDSRNQREGFLITKGVKGQTFNSLFKHFTIYETGSKEKGFNTLHQFNAESFKPASQVVNSLLEGFKSFFESDLIDSAARHLYKTNAPVDCFIYPSSLNKEVVFGYPLTRADLIAISLNGGEFVLKHAYDFSQISDPVAYAAVLTEESKDALRGSIVQGSYIEYEIKTSDLRVSEAHKALRDINPLDQVLRTADPLFYLFMDKFNAVDDRKECLNYKVFDKQILNNLDLMEDYIIDDINMLGNMIGLSFLSSFQIGEATVKVPMNFRDYNLALFTEHARMFRLPINYIISHTNLGVINDMFEYQEEEGAAKGIDKSAIKRQNAYFWLDLIKTFIKASPVHQKLIRDYSSFIFKVLSYKEKMNISDFRGHFIRKIYNEVGLRLFALYAILFEAIDSDFLGIMIEEVITNLNDEFTMNDIFEIRDNL